MAPIMCATVPAACARGQVSVRVGAGVCLRSPKKVCVRVAFLEGMFSKGAFGTAPCVAGLGPSRTRFVAPHVASSAAAASPPPRAVLIHAVCATRAASGGAPASGPSPAPPPPLAAALSCLELPALHALLCLAEYLCVDALAAAAASAALRSLDLRRALVVLCTWAGGDLLPSAGMQLVVRHALNVVVSARVFGQN